MRLPFYLGKASASRSTKAATTSCCQRSVASDKSVAGETTVNAELSGVPRDLPRESRDALVRLAASTPPVPAMPGAPPRAELATQPTRA